MPCQKEFEILDGAIVFAEPDRPNSSSYFVEFLDKDLDLFAIMLVHFVYPQTDNDGIRWSNGFLNEVEPIDIVRWKMQNGTK